MDHTGTPYWDDEYYEEDDCDCDGDFFEPDLWGYYDEDPPICDSTETVSLRKAKNGHLSLEHVNLFLLEDGQVTYNSAIYTLGECNAGMRQMLIDLGRQVQPGSSMELTNQIIEQYFLPEPSEQPVISVPADLDDILF